MLSSPENRGGEDIDDEDDCGAPGNGGTPYVDLSGIVVNADGGGEYIEVLEGSDTVILIQYEQGGAPTAPNSGSQNDQSKTAANCAAQAASAMNNGPSIAPTTQNIIDGIFSAALNAATDGGVKALSLLKGFVKGASVRSLEHAIQNGLLYQATFGTCMQNAGLSSYGYNPAPVSFGRPDI